MAVAVTFARSCCARVALRPLDGRDIGIAMTAAVSRDAAMRVAG
jgi:hypothetical protein